MSMKRSNRKNTRGRDFNPNMHHVKPKPRAHNANFNSNKSVVVFITPLTISAQNSVGKMYSDFYKTHELTELSLVTTF